MCRLMKRKLEGRGGPVRNEPKTRLDFNFFAQGRRSRKAARSEFRFHCRSFSQIREGHKADYKAIYRLPGSSSAHCQTIYTPGEQHVLTVLEYKIQFGLAGTAPIKRNEPIRDERAADVIFGEGAFKAAETDDFRDSKWAYTRAISEYKCPIMYLM